MQRKGATFEGRKIGFEGIVGAVLLEFLDRSAEEQDEVVSRWLGSLGSQLSADEPATAQERPSGTVEVPVEENTPKAGAKRKRV